MTFRPIPNIVRTPPERTLDVTVSVTYDGRTYPIGGGKLYWTGTLAEDLADLFDRAAEALREEQ